jgi:hypothetical protein
MSPIHLRLHGTDALLERVLRLASGSGERVAVRLEPHVAPAGGRTARAEGAHAGEVSPGRVADEDVVVRLSAEARRASGGNRSPSDAAVDAEPPSGAQESRSASPATGEHEGPGRVRLTDEERREIQDLEKRDREVRQHEAAHKSALGGFAAGAPQFTFVTGPDGRRYASGGEVAVDTSPIPGDPEATIRKMNTIRRAALAPQEPSAGDRAIAAKATREALAARRDLSAPPGETSPGNARALLYDQSGRSAPLDPPPGARPGARLDVLA